MPQQVLHARDAALTEEPFLLGATPGADGRTVFNVWAPAAESLAVRLLDGSDRVVRLEPCGRGYHLAAVENAPPGTRYFLRFPDGRERPDPASRSQPEGVHGPSEVVDPSFAWTDRGWFNPPLSSHIIYELHIGTFSREGTFDGAIAHLDSLRELGATAVEIMPIAQFPGDRNWGYDGVGLFAAQNSYGGPQGLRRFVNACHERGIAVVLDVVYNHLGPEGNCLGEFGPYFTSRYSTPWGKALNFDGDGSDDVRRFFIENALYWITDCHIDALRLDAVHAIIDPSPCPFVEELIAEVHRRADELNRRVQVICESAANDPRLIRRPEFGGLGADAQWNDDFHHIVVSLATAGRGLRYAGFGPFDQLARAFADGYVFGGEFNEHHGRRHGRSSRDVPAERFVVFAQNHDQVGNQRGGERLSHLASPEACRVAAGLVLLSPFVPLLFMGEEYGETAPFLYFVSHSDPELVEAVRKGRREEFRAYGWEGDPPDPQDPANFLRSKLDHSLRSTGVHARMFDYYRTLVELRRTIPALKRLSKDDLHVQAFERERVFAFRRWAGESQALTVANLNGLAGPVAIGLPDGRWTRALDSADARWGGPGAISAESLAPREGHAEIELAPMSLALYVRRGR